MGWVYLIPGTEGFLTLWVCGSLGGQNGKEYICESFKRLVQEWESALVKTSLRWLSLAESSRGKSRCVYPPAHRVLIVLFLAQSPCMCEIILGKCGCYGQEWHLLL